MSITSNPFFSLVRAMLIGWVKWWDLAFSFTRPLGAPKSISDSSASITLSFSVLPAFSTALAHRCQPFQTVAAESVMYS